jgi:4a-hydroxytetrahydrobiopterin dehydratase
MTLPSPWTQDPTSLVLDIKCKDFKHALALINYIGDVAEELNHHPDINLSNYNHLVVTTSTHSEGAVTAKDYELANKISEYLRHK